jgi:hypothetical protein
MIQPRPFVFLLNIVARETKRRLLARTCNVGNGGLVDETSARCDGRAQFCSCAIPNRSSSSVFGKCLAKFSRKRCSGGESAIRLRNTTFEELDKFFSQENVSQMNFDIPKKACLFFHLRGGAKRMPHGSTKNTLCWHFPDNTYTRPRRKVELEQAPDPRSDCTTSMCVTSQLCE